MSDDDVYSDDVDDEVDQVDIDFDIVIDDDQSDASDHVIRRRKNISARHRIEDYMERRRLRDELDDPDFFID
jgi:hypothetical protein